jgi:hypothetical protein
MSLANLLSPNTPSKSAIDINVHNLNVDGETDVFDLTVTGTTTISGPIITSGNISIVNGNPALTVQNNIGNANGAKVIMAATVPQLGTFQAFQASDGSGQLQNFYPNANIGITSNGTGNILLTPGASGNVNTLGPLNASGNIILSNSDPLLSIVDNASNANRAKIRLSGTFPDTGFLALAQNDLGVANLTNTSALATADLQLQCNHANIYIIPEPTHSVILPNTSAQLQLGTPGTNFTINAPTPSINQAVSIPDSQNFSSSFVVSTQNIVTQITSTTTAVTINGSSGVITTFGQSALAGATLQFQVNNSYVTASSVVNLTATSYPAGYNVAGCPLVAVQAVTGGSFMVQIVNLNTVSALSGILKLSFLVC